ncbi:hypothetical protein BAU15_05210 [Enterococcus sp. JM4C]|uniref:hypothetical protein n=1 Tax=Candidatus Enterococcus huntleyi TaxID=1857217 RepID=UPI00137A85B7|nr:hypothetical protein [Enterococcus sp. JM4C]KAF1295152.1 hypothetical protein BAU15_05210 [Enterococcus sp. JM4C]
MKRDILKRFEQLERHVKHEVETISKDLILECDTYEEIIEDICQYYKSEFKLDDYVYQEIHQQAMKQATKR